MGLRVGVYLGSSAKLGKQLKWADDQRASVTVLYGAEEQAVGEVTVRDMRSGEQNRVTLAEAAAKIRRLITD